MYCEKRVERIYSFTTIYKSNAFQKDCSVVLTVGRLEQQKGYDLLLPIWKQIIERMPDWKLYIVGNGTEKDLLIAKARDLNILDSIRFISATSKV